MSKNAKSSRPNQQQAIAALLSRKSIKAAALSINIGERTLQRWLTNPAFIQNLKRAENQLVESGIRQMLFLQEKAINALEDLLSSQNETVRRHAADDILTHMLKLRQIYQVEERLTELETMLDEHEISQSNQ